MQPRSRRAGAARGREVSRSRAVPTRVPSPNGDTSSVTGHCRVPYPRARHCPGTRSVGSRNLAREKGHECTARSRPPWASRDVSFPSPRVGDATRVRAQRPSPGTVKSPFSSFSSCCERENEDLGSFSLRFLPTRGRGLPVAPAATLPRDTDTGEMPLGERNEKAPRSRGGQRNNTQKEGKRKREKNTNKQQQNKGKKSRKIRAVRVPRVPVPSPTAPQRLEPSAASCGAAASRTRTPTRPHPAPARGSPSDPKSPSSIPSPPRPGGEAGSFPQRTPKPGRNRRPLGAPRAPLASRGPGGEVGGVGEGGGDSVAQPEVTNAKKEEKGKRCGCHLPAPRAAAPALREPGASPHLWEPQAGGC